MSAARFAQFSGLAVPFGAFMIGSNFFYASGFVNAFLCIYTSLRQILVCDSGIHEFENQKPNVVLHLGANPSSDEPTVRISRPSQPVGLTITNTQSPDNPRMDAEATSTTLEARMAAHSQGLYSRKVDAEDSTSTLELENIR